MMEIEDITDYADDDEHRVRDFEKLAGIMIHRCGVDLQTGVVLGYDAPSVVDAFLGRVDKWKAVAKATGGENAYSVYIGGDLGPEEFDGKIWQALPLDEVGYHGRRFSVPYLGIGLICDAREKAPSVKQYQAATLLCSELCSAWRWDPYKQIKGHGEVPKAHNGSKAPGKPAACPGDLLNMYSFRNDVEILMKEGPRVRLHEAGLVFGS